MTKFIMNPNAKLYNEYYGGLIMIEGKIIALNEDYVILLKFINQIKLENLKANVSEIVHKLIEKKIIIQKDAYERT